MSDTNLSQLIIHTSVYPLSKILEINFNFFTAQQVAGSKNADDVTAQPYELDLQPVNHAIHSGNGPRLQGGSGFLCHVTEESVCTHCCQATITPCC